MGEPERRKQDLSRAARRRIRMAAAVAYERELGAALKALQTEFERWNAGEFDAFELNDKIHAFHQGTSRDLYKDYTRGSAEAHVARALAEGILREDEVEEGDLSHLRGLIAYFSE